MSKDCHKRLNIKEGASYFPFDYTMCKFITDLSFTNVGLVSTVCLRAKQIIYFRNDTEKKMFQFITDLFFTNVGLVLTVCLRAN